MLACKRRIYVHAHERLIYTGEDSYNNLRDYMVVRQYAQGNPSQQHELRISMAPLAKFDAVPSILFSHLMQVRFLPRALEHLGVRYIDSRSPGS